jgi:hypothetical protein
MFLVADEPLTVTPPTCANCGRPWLDPAEHWRSRLDIDDEPRLFYPECDEREFSES